MHSVWTYSAAAAGVEMVARNGCRTSVCRRPCKGPAIQSRQAAKHRCPASASRRRLTTRRCTPRIRLVRTNSAIAMLLAWLLVGSGICLCLGAIPDQPTSHSHDCSTEPAVPASDQDTSCERGCNAEDAVRARAEARAVAVVELVPGTCVVPLEVPVETAAESASSLPARYSQSEPAPHAPPYILHSVLLI